jgi:hypothetical protein
MDMVQQHEDSSSSATSSPLHSFSAMPLRYDEERGLRLIHLLLNCTAAAASGRLDAVNAALERIAALADADGDAMQRVAAASAEALARIALRAWLGLRRALLLPRAAPPELAAAARSSFLDLCPFLRLAGAAANQAVLGAMEGEQVVHVVDLGGADPAQWMDLLHLLAARPEYPPHRREREQGRARPRGHAALRGGGAPGRALPVQPWSPAWSPWRWRPSA